MPLAKSIWLSQLLKNFYPDTSFLKVIPNRSELVTNNTIEVAEAGVDPQVLIDNTTYPIAVVKDNPIPHSLKLRKMETENSLVRSAETVQYSFNALEGNISKHRGSLEASAGTLAAHAIAPATSTAWTPILSTTGPDDGTGRRRLVSTDIVLLKQAFDDMRYPLDKRYLTLTPQHFTDLFLEDKKLFADLIDFVNGVPKRFAGFNIMQHTGNAGYNRTTLAKLPYKAVLGANETTCSFSFYADEIFQCDGDLKMYGGDNEDAKERAYIVGFEKWFLCMPYRAKGAGAIVSAAA